MKKGSMTAEAALVMPLFLFCFLALCYLFQGIKLQDGVSQSLYGTARFASTLGQISSGENTWAKGLLVQGDFLNRWKKEESSPCLWGGDSAIALIHSELEGENGQLLLQADYALKIPVPFLSMRPWPVSIQYSAREFIGDDTKCGTGYVDTGEEGQGEEEEDRLVYITETGTVYHLSEGCSHLQLKIQTVSADTVGEERNQNGGRYYPCEKCCKNAEIKGTLWIAQEGNRYHISPSCSGLKRTIQEVWLSNLPGWRCCYDCGE